MRVSGHAQKTALASGKTHRSWDKGCYAVQYLLVKPLFDDHFGHSYGDLSKKEGNGLYAYLGGPLSEQRSCGKLE